MCEHNCFDLSRRPRTVILFGTSFSPENRERILYNDEDWYDSEFLDDTPAVPEPEPNVPRNLSTVSKAATEEYWRQGS